MSSRLSMAQLRVLDAVANRRNFSDAAKSLSVSQPSVSNHVSSVEKRYGTRLFDRRGHVAVPTPELESLLPRIRTTLLLVDELETELESRKSLETGQLRVGYSTYQVAVPILTRFMQDHPSVKVEARDMASHDLLANLENGDLDVACMTAREIPAHLSGIPLKDLRVVLAVPENHPFARCGSIKMRDLEGQPLIQREMSSTTRRMLEAHAAMTRTQLTTILAVGSWGSIVDMVRAGLGIGVCLDVEVSGVPDLVCVEIEDAKLVASQYMVHLPQRRMISAVKAFMASAERLNDK